MTKLFPIPTLEGRYSITKEGDIFSHISHKSTRGNIWLKPYTRGRNLYIGLNVNGIPRTFKIKSLLQFTFPNDIHYITIKDGIELTPIPNMEGLYSITKCGKIYSHITNRWMKLSINESGYQTVDLRKDGKRIFGIISRLVAQTFIPNPEFKPQVNHRDGNKLNNHVSNLEWATQQENTDHAELNGLFRHPKYATKHSKYKGVVWKCNKWNVRKCINGIRYQIGNFTNEEDAHSAYLNFHL